MPGRGRGGRARAADAARPALARARRARLSRDSYRRRRVETQLRLSPGHRLALAEGPFVEAWLRVRGNTPGGEAEAGERFLAPLRAHLAVAGMGHLSEVADAEPPYRPAAARSRPGRWARCCASAGCSPSQAQSDRSDRLRGLIRQGGQEYDAVCKEPLGGDPSGERARPRPAPRHAPPSARASPRTSPAPPGWKHGAPI